MASVFTYDPDPPRISSPWLNTPVSTPRLLALDEPTHEQRLGGLVSPPPILLSDSGIVKLVAEPQDGPIEYKLHLLLRPRRSFTSLSTGSYVSGSFQSKSRHPPLKAGLPPTRIVNRGSLGTPPFQARQKRLEHLTTQLLWRLQQSSPYHSSSTLRLVPPALPETGPVLGPPAHTGKLLPGLEDSHGALYEIGVSDDGVFVGLTRDEMDESLINLRAMSASLGCKVEILRTVIVGDCEWTESASLGTVGGAPQPMGERVCKENLWVVEALVLPDTRAHSSKDAPVSPLDVQKNVASATLTDKDHDTVPVEDSLTEQLRVSLAGGTTSGKSSLVGTLTTSALDSGRGKTRLNLLKHRHEIESGITSSVAPELIGYKRLANQNRNSHVTAVVNYGLGNVSSWNDVHNAAEGERLVILVDSAGHPRYRRTTVRGLVSWAPHWTLCCIAAEDERDSANAINETAQREETGRSSPSDDDFSTAHLELCLKLGMPLVLVITKLDVATNQGLRNTLSRVLSTLKSCQRNPVVLRPDPTSRVSEELQHIPLKNEDEVLSMLAKNGADELVPIVFTSAVKGSGISKLHALLRHLPLQRQARTTNQLMSLPRHESVFHIDEIFSKEAAAASTLANDKSLLAAKIILSGLLSYDELSIGDFCLLGPLSIYDDLDPRPINMSRARSYPSRLPSSPTSKLSHSDSRPELHLDVHAANRTKWTSDHTLVSDYPVLDPALEWVSVRVVSVRNLRLPLRKLLPDQVGTVGIQFVNYTESTRLIPKLRKGMILIRQESPHSSYPQTYSGFKAVFPAEDYHMMEPGAAYNVYIASIRASAKIVSVEALPTDSVANGGSSSDHSTSTNAPPDEDEDLFIFDPDAEEARAQWISHLPLSPSASSARREVRDQPLPPKEIEVVFNFVGSREWIELGKQVLIMPKMMADGSSGLDGFVGKVSEPFTAYAGVV